MLNKFNLSVMLRFKKVISNKKNYVSSRSYGRRAVELRQNLEFSSHFVPPEFFHLRNETHHMN